MKKVIVFAVIITAVLTAAAYNFLNREKTYSVDIFALDTYINLQINAGKDGDDILAECTDRIKTLERLFSHTIDESDISKINRRAGDGTFVQVSRETMEIIKISKELYEQSGGAFDITAAPAVNLWDVTGENPRVPSESDVRSAKELICADGIITDYSLNAVRLRKNGQQISLGAVAKGYITDDIIGLLKERGVDSAILNLGGNTAAIGTKPNGKPWRVGIRSPDDADKLLGVLSVADKCVITSGDYERCFVYDGVRYHHIIDPETGCPARSGVRSVTVIGDNAAVADCLSTTCFILGREKSEPLLEKYGFCAVFCDDDMNLEYVGEVRLENVNNGVG